MPELVAIATNTGYFLRDGEAVYLNAHDAVLGNDVDNNFSIYLGQYMGLFHVSRSGLVASLVGIPLGANILSATLSLYGENDTSDTDFDVVLVSGADLADIFVLADFGDLLNDIISLGSINTSTYLLPGWNVITLNTAGIAALQAAIGGTVRFGVRSSRDISATPPTGNEFVYFYGTDAIASRVPRLTITYITTPIVETDPATEIT